jgi:hypothetical protein
VDGILVGELVGLSHGLSHKTGQRSGIPGFAQIASFSCTNTLQIGSSTYPRQVGAGDGASVGVNEGKLVGTVLGGAVGVVVGNGVHVPQVAGQISDTVLVLLSHLVANAMHNS